jgi:predicted GH43/DUF377 family glycosyl hydrolase
MTPAPGFVDAGVEMRADPARVTARLYLPGEGPTRARSRAADIVERIMALSPEALRDAARAILDSFAVRHEGFVDLVKRHAATVAFSDAEREPTELTLDQSIVLGAAFTMEYAVEGAALCNPSAVRHPDQSGLAPGELRVALGLRAIGEGHVSSIGFASAVIGEAGWTFEQRRLPLSSATLTEGDWSRDHFREALEQRIELNELSTAIVRALPDEFRSGQIEDAIRELPVDLAQRRDLYGDVDAVRTMAWSAYHATFDGTGDLTQRVLLPFAAEESHGMEDARFVLFDLGDGTVEYRATYTAYDGRSIAPRLIVSPDLRHFRIHRLSGEAAVNKGMAMFPRRIGDELFALTRTDGENLSMARSRDGLVWTGQAVVHAPDRLWDAVQTGNCGSPIETDRGWLVLIHGVGPMRTYSIGALLLDLDDPERVIARLEEPLVHPDGLLRDGYVPNVVYSCGAIVHDDTLWLPFGVGDARIRVGSIGLTRLLDAMAPTTP